MRQNFRRRVSVSTAALMMFGALSACSEGGPGSSDGTYKLGAAMALSGDQASLGKDFAEFIRYGVEDANKEYASKDIKIELVLEDHGGTADRGVAALNKLATVENVPLVTTGWSDAVNAMAPMAEDVGTALMAVANAPQLEGASPNLINIYTLGSIENRKFATYLQDDMELEDAAVIYTDDSALEGSADVFSEAFEDAGGEVVASESIPPGAVDVSSGVTKVLRANPDIVHVQMTSTDGATTIKALRAQGFDGQITTFAATGADSTARQSSGDAMTGVIYSSSRVFDPTAQATQDLLARFKKDNGRDPVGLAYAMTFYDSAFLYAELVDRVKEAGDEVNGDNLVKALEANSTMTLPIQGEITFNENRTLEGAINLVRVTDPAGPVASDEVIATIE